MNYKSFLFIALLLVSLTGCHTELEMNSATRQSWAGGARGSGRGVMYNVELQKPDNNEITIEKVWLGDREKGKWMSPEIQLRGQLKQQGLTLPAGRAIFTLMFRETFPGEANPNQKPDPPLVDADLTLLPEDFQQGAVIFFKLPNSKVHKLIVANFTELEPLNYP